MTNLQKLIRNAVEQHGSMQLRVGKTSPATMGTVRALQRAGYTCVCVGSDTQVMLFQVYK
jgi:hypothetical protein